MAKLNPTRCWKPGREYTTYRVGHSDDATIAECAEGYRKSGYPLHFLGAVKLPKTGGVYRVPLSDLEGVLANPWKPQRLEDALAKYRAGMTPKPIQLGVSDDGRVYINDGNHRLTAARTLGIPTIDVQWSFEHEERAAYEREMAQYGRANPAGKDTSERQLSQHLAAAWQAGQQARAEFGIESENQFWTMMSYGELGKHPNLWRWMDDLDMADFFSMGYNGHPLPMLVRGWRYGNIPTSGRSYNARDDKREQGVSMVWVETGEETADSVSLMFIKPGRAVVWAEGWLLPWKGSDGEPLLFDARKIKRPAGLKVPKRNPVADPDELFGLMEEDDQKRGREVVKAELPHAIARALRAGAKPPLTFAGAGAYGIVLCDTDGRAYKVARHWPESMETADSLRDEARWFEVAATIPSIRGHVARVYGYDESNAVLVRECVQRRKRAHWDDNRLWELHTRISKIMGEYGFRRPEFKTDSYVYHPKRGPVLVDASQVARDLGWANARRAQELLRGAPPREKSEASDVIHGLRMDAGRDLPARIAEPLADKLEAYAKPNPTRRPSRKGYKRNQVLETVGAVLLATPIEELAIAGAVGALASSKGKSQ